MLKKACSEEMWYGLTISLFIHIIVLALPVSMVMKGKIQEVEFFVFIEEVGNHLALVTTGKEVVQPKKAEVLKPVKVEKITAPADNPLLKGHHQVMPEKDIAVRNPSDDTPQPQTATQLFEAKEKFSSQSYSHRTIEGLINTEFGSIMVCSGRTGKPVDTEFGSAIAPAFLHREMPEYPMLARRLGKEGRVVLRLTIDDRGNLLNVEVVEDAGYGFTEAAIAAVKRSTFLPAKKDSNPIASRALLPIKFKLRRN